MVGWWVWTGWLVGVDYLVDGCEMAGCLVWDGWLMDMDSLVGGWGLADWWM